MPKRAKIRMNKKRRKSKLTIDRILLKSETTKFRSDAQCLEMKMHQQSLTIRSNTNLVTLNILSRRKDRRTETPNDSSGLKCVQITSNIEPTIT
jgi:hypothetical protein